VIGMPNMQSFYPPLSELLKIILKKTITITDRDMANTACVVAVEYMRQQLLTNFTGAKKLNLTNELQAALVAAAISKELCIALRAIVLPEISALLLHHEDKSYAIFYDQMSSICKVDLSFDLDEGFIDSGKTLDSAALSFIISTELQKKFKPWKDNNYAGELFPSTPILFVSQVSQTLFAPIATKSFENNKRDPKCIECVML
jgi:hypothetical protein